MIMLRLMAMSVLKIMQILFVALDDSIHMERRRLKSEGDGGDIIPFKTRKSPQLPTTLITFIDDQLY